MIVRWDSFEYDRPRELQIPETAARNSLAQPDRTIGADHDLLTS
jgi:hypothetical protein